MVSESNPEEPEGGVGRTIKGLLEPLRPVYNAWMIVVQVFSWITARLVAVLLFVVGFIPYGIVMRLLGVDPLNRDLTEERESYWTEPTADNHDLDDFRKQY